MLPVANACVPSASLMVAAFSPLSAASAWVKLRRGCAHRQHIRRPVAEGNAQAHGQQDGENENPENRLRLAQEKAKAHHRQLIEAAHAPAYSSRKFLPVSPTNTSSRVAEWVRNSLRCKPLAGQGGKDAAAPPYAAREQKADARLHPRGATGPPQSPSAERDRPRHARRCCR